jgi:hypothetical protein
MFVLTDWESILIEVPSMTVPLPASPMVALTAAGSVMVPLLVSSAVRIQSLLILTSAVPDIPAGFTVKSQSGGLLWAGAELEYLLLAALMIADVAVDLAPVLPLVLRSVVTILTVCVVQLRVSPAAGFAKVAEVLALSEPERVLDPDDVMFMALEKVGTAASAMATSATESASFFTLLPPRSSGTE